MKLPGKLEVLTARYERLTLRERALVALALLAGLIFAWDALVMPPLGARERGVRDELATLLSDETQTESAGALQSAAANMNQLLEREHALEEEVARIEEKLAAAGAGLIEPQRMVEVVREVLARQHSLALVSLRNQPVRPLVVVAGGASATGPFVHPVELVVEGDFFSVLAYLHELEALPWRLHWQTLELESHRYPLNRVRIELSTLGKERAWLGV